MNNIIEPNENYEQLIFDRLNDIKDASHKRYPNDYQNILATMYNLYMSNKLIQADRFKIAVQESDDIELVFLSDMDNFDYGKFNLEWLKMYSVGLLDEICKNNTARHEISKIYADKVEHGEIDTQLLRLYFKHFANVVEES